ncbi:MAG: DUF4384 domain-containing protein [Cyanobacteria bacterium REEB67]|nr:DUF4384 domain-containing protein [Cyanobacteria bacterium REEB67]
MKTASLLALLSVCALSQGLSLNAFAADEPTAQDLKNSKSRGIFLKVPGSPAAFEMQKNKTESKPTAQPTAKSGGVKATLKETTKIPARESLTKVEKEGNKVSPRKVRTAPQAVQHESGKSAVNQKPATAKSTTPKGKTATIVQKGPSTVSAAPGKAQSDAVIQAWLNKGGKHPNYKDGEKMQVCVKANKDCNIVIYDFDGKGTLTQIFPNEFQKEAAVRAGETVTIGGDNSSFDFQVALADGAARQTERLFIFAYPAKEEAPLSVAMNKVPDSPFRSANMSLEQYRNMVNQSKVYFARSVKVLPKKNSNLQQVSNQLNDGDSAPNKTELSFSVEK